MSTGDVAQCPKCGRYLYPSDTNILPECDCEKQNCGGSSGWIRPVLSVDEISEIISKSELTRLALLPWTERSLSAIEFDKKIKTIAEAIMKAIEVKRK